MFFTLQTFSAYLVDTEGELFTRQQLAAALRALPPGKRTMPARLWKRRHLATISSCQFSIYATWPKIKVSRQLAPLASMGHLILFSVHELALAS